MPRKKKSTSSKDDELYKEIDGLGKPEPQDYRKGWEKVKFINPFKCKNEKQKSYIKSIKENDMTFTVGPSGVGKSLCALAGAVELLKNSDNEYNKLILVVPVVQVEDQSVGYIKGSLDAKLAGFENPYLYNLSKLIGFDTVARLKEGGYIETMCVSFARGVNFDNCIVICGECQQYSKESMLTLITRIGENCKMIFEGDTYQCDNITIKKKKNDSGILHAKNCLTDIDGINFIEFDKTEIVRNPIISKILEKWDPEQYGNRD